MQLFRGIPLLFYPGTSFSWDCTKLKSGILYQRAHSKFCLGAGYQRDSSFLRQFSAGINRERLSPVTGAAFPASVRAPISCQSLRLALTGSNSEALWQQLAQTSSRKPCNVPGHELFSASFSAGNFAAYTTGFETCLKHQKQESRRFRIKDIINIGNALKLRYRCYFREKAGPLLHGHIARIPCAGLR